MHKWKRTMRKKVLRGQTHLRVMFRMLRLSKSERYFSDSDGKIDLSKAAMVDSQYFVHTSLGGNFTILSMEIVLF